MTDLIIVLVCILGITFLKADFFLKLLCLVLAIPIWFALWDIFFGGKKK
jgi:hypothetical protein